MDIFWYFVIGGGVFILVNQLFMAHIRYKDAIEEKKKNSQKLRNEEAKRQQKQNV